MDNLGSEDTIIKTSTSELAGIINNRFDTAKSERTAQEQVWIEAMQNFNGEYGSSFKAREGGSSVFVNITQMKTMAAYARVMAVMMGPSGFPWNIKPTPHPALAFLGVEEKDAIETPELDPALRGEIEDARRACDGMKNRISDDLVESFWEEKFSRGALDLVSLGTMCFKGPFAAPPKPKKWILKDVEENQSMADKIKGFLGIRQVEKKYVLSHDPMDEYRGTIDWLSPFELYTDPGAYLVEECMYVVHRHVFSKAQVVELARGKGFNIDEIEAALTNHPDGNWASESWEGFIDTINRRSQSGHKSQRYTVLEFWGYLGSRELAMAGAPVKDEGDNKLYLCNAWVIGSQCIKVAISGNQSQRIPYFIVPYEKVPHKIWGRGNPEKMADPQAIINASSRAMVENMGMAAGPQLIYDVNRIAPGTKVEQIVPWGIWPTKNIEGINTPAIQFVKIDPILGELKLIQDIFRNFVNEVTSIPDMASGINSEHNRTLGGMSMLFGAADSYTRTVIFNIDNYLTKPMIRALYDWEMQYAPDPSIKGDMKVNASGVQGMLAKELTSQRMAELLQSVGQIPGGADYLNMPEIMREIFRSLDVSNEAVVLTEQEVAKKRSEQQQSSVQQQAQIAQAQNLPKPKAETTPPDMMMQVLEKTNPTDPIYPIIYEKWLSMINQLDPQSEAALSMMKNKNVLADKAFATQQEIDILKQDLELSRQIGETGVIPPQTATETQEPQIVEPPETNLGDGFQQDVQPTQ